MLFSSRFCFCFVAIPKTGSTSVHNILTPYADIALLRTKPHSNLSICTHALPEDIDGYFGTEFRQKFMTFTVVRNPIDRFVSGYQYAKRPELADKYHPKHKNYTGNLSFNEFIELKEKEENNETSLDLNVTDFDAVLRIDKLSYDAERIKGFLPENFTNAMQSVRLNPSLSDPNTIITPYLRKKLENMLEKEFDLYHKAETIKPRFKPNITNFDLIKFNAQYPEIYCESILGHALNLIKNGQPKVAVEKLKILKECDYLDAWGIATLADCYMEFGDIKAFISIVSNELLSINSNDLTVLFQIARYYFLIKKFQESLDLFIKSMERCLLPMKYYYIAFQCARALKSVGMMKYIVNKSCEAHPNDSRLLDMFEQSVI